MLCCVGIGRGRENGELWNEKEKKEMLAVRRGGGE